MGNTILIAEDNGLMLRILSLLFRGAGFTVYPASTCAEAARLAAARLPDCFLLDYQLADGTAQLVCSFIRGHEGLKDAPVVIHSGHSEEAEHCYRDCQADVFVEKGRPHSELLALVKRQLSRSRWRGGALKKTDMLLDARTLRLIRPSYPPIQLSPEQFRFLSILMEKTPAFVREEELCRRVYGDVGGEKSTALWSMAYRLRLKLGPQLARRIKNRRGLGWIYTEPRVHAGKPAPAANNKIPL